MTTPTTLWVIRNHNGKYVHKNFEDGIGGTMLAHEVKTWKTESGAKRWLADRGGINWTVVSMSEAGLQHGVYISVSKRDY